MLALCLLHFLQDAKMTFVPQVTPTTSANQTMAIPPVLPPSL